MNPDADQSVRRQLDLLVRSQRGRLVGGLVRYLGGSRLALAEDVAQEAVLKAIAVWPFQGMPDHPTAWLTRVARNKAIDRLRREQREEALVDDSRAAEDDPAASTLLEPVADQELQLICLCCHPELSELDQLALTVKVVSGFTVEEVARVFLMAKATLAQRLVRAKRRLRRLDRRIDAPLGRFEVRARLATVCKVIYLMFALGYAPRTGQQVVRHDLAMEAVRLADELAAGPVTATPETAALAALLNLQASRLAARSDADGNVVLLRDQDRTLWNKTLVAKGMSYLQRSAVAGTMSRYHLEAGIAAAHATAPTWEATDWPTIVSHYETLELMTDSPVVRINACVARAQLGRGEEALRCLDQLRQSKSVVTYGPFHIARAEILRRLKRPTEAAESYRQAITCGVSTPVERLLERRLASCL